MNRNKLKIYAPKARRDFIAAVTARAIKFGISKDAIEPVQVQGNVALIAGQAHPRKVADQRSKLEARVKNRGFEQVMEEAAYTWFNRFAAIRYMEVHGYLDHGYRVLSHPEGKATPEIVEHALHLDLPGLDKEKVIELKLDGTKEGDLYRMLLMAQCNALNAAMPFLFERIDDETELLLPDNLLHSDSVIRQMVNEIEEADWQEIEIIGWLYQFYISEKKDQVIGKVVKSEDIPAATQLFTPNWIVKYMVQNTLGAKWLATYPQSGIRAKMEFYVEPAEQTDEVNAKLAEITPKELNPEEITFLDPACGSGHILVEAYDLFKDIYLERGYVLRDVPRLILEKNLFGLDIDDRAAQMAAFALLMKARADDRRLLSDIGNPTVMNVIAIQSSEGLAVDLIGSGFQTNDHFPETRTQPALAKIANRSIDRHINEMIALFTEAKIFGSLIQVPESLFFDVPRRAIDTTKDGDDKLEQYIIDEQVARFNVILNQSMLLRHKYDCIATNPPYMGVRGMPLSMKDFAVTHYAAGKSDIFSMFMERCQIFGHEASIISMVTMQSWMFLSSFEMIRHQILRCRSINSFIHIGYNSFPELNSKVVQACVFSMLNHKVNDFNSRFIDLNNKIPQSTEKGCLFKSGDYVTYDTKVERFSSIPGSPIVYWASRRTVDCYSTMLSLSDFGMARRGLQTGNSERFIRIWHEVSCSNIMQDVIRKDGAAIRSERWFRFNNGGFSRRWYGCIDYVVDWFRDGRDIKASNNSIIPSEDLYMQEGVSWLKVTSNEPSFRLHPAGVIPGDASPCLYTKSDSIVFCAILNSKAAIHFVSTLSSTLNLEVGVLSLIPIPDINQIKSELSSVASELISISKMDWDSFETSIDFTSHPFLMKSECMTLSSAFAGWSQRCIDNINNTITLEGSCNRIVSDAYGIADEIDCRVDRNGVVLARPDMRRDVAYFISYVIGCLMGRYSLDEPGLIYANSGNVGFDPCRYTTFPADDDGIVPIMQADWFDDDGTNRFVEFLKVAWSPETLTENLKFVADNLGAKSGETPIDTIRRYLSTDFFKDHLKTYKKRPIYWLFSSGKEKAFEALVYLHRYNEGTLSRMRMEYVTPLQGRIASRIDQLGRDIDAAASTAAQNKLRKEQEKLKKQQAELVKFDEELRHYADMRIKLDLDDGVKVNYGKFGPLLAETKAITGGSDE